MRRQYSRGSPIVLLLLAAVTFACNDRAAPTGVNAEGRPLHTSASVAEAALPGFSSTLPAPADDQSSSSITLGTFNEKILASVKVDGLMDMIYNTGTMKGQTYQTVDPYGKMHWGMNSCYMDVVVRGNATGTETFVASPCGDDSPNTTNPDVGTRPTAEGVRYLNGAVTASRNVMWQSTGQCGYDVRCWNYRNQGEVTVAVTPVPATLSLTAAPPSVDTGGKAVTFTLALSPSQVNGKAVPFRRTGIHWITASGEKTPPCNLAAPGACTATVRETGTLVIEAVVNGAPVTVQARVRAVPCPTGDTLLDEPAFRRGLAAAWSESMKNGNKERGVSLFDSAGVYVERLSPMNPSDTPCSNANSQPQPLPGKRVADGHTHPFRIYETLPKSCNAPGDTVTKQYVWGLGGFSSADWARAQMNNAPHYVVDKDSIYQADVPDTSDFVWDAPKNTYVMKKNAWKGKRHGYARKLGSCVRVAYEG